MKLELKKGQKVKLSDIANSKQIKIEVMVQLKSGQADVTCFGVDAMNKLSDDRYFIFYNQPKSPEEAITMTSKGNSTGFDLDISKLPSTIKKLVLTAALDDNMIMSDVLSGCVSIVSGGQTVAEYSFKGSDFKSEKAVILCEVYEKDGIWRISVVSDGFNGGLSSLLAYFGGSEESSTPIPLPKPVPKPNNVVPLPVKPAEPEKPQQSVINLKKSGDTHKINLSKNSSSIHVNLNWNQKVSGGFFGGTKNIDLDLACMYKLTNGAMGVVQALGNSFGSEHDIPFIKLDSDDRTGTSTNGENMFFYKPELIEFAVVFAYIYEGVANWRSTNAGVVLKQQGSPDIELRMDSASTNDRFCVVASMKKDGSQLAIIREEKYFKGHREVDSHYGFGFRWTAGKK